MRKYMVLFNMTLLFIGIILLMNGCGQQQADIEQKKGIARLVVKAWNTGDFSALDNHYTRDIVYRNSPFPDIQGLEALKQHISDMRTEFPDLQITLDDIIVEGERIAMQGMLRGTQTGLDQTLGISTGKKVDYGWGAICHIMDDKISYVRLFGGNLAHMQQLGYAIYPPLSENTFARVTCTECAPGNINTVLRIFKEKNVPAAKKQDGYRGIISLLDPATGKSLTISIWNSEADAVANEQSGYYQDVLDNFEGMFTAPPIQEEYVVTVLE